MRATIGIITLLVSTSSAVAPSARAADESVPDMQGTATQATATQSGAALIAEGDVALLSSYYSRGAYVFERTLNLQPALSLGVDLPQFGALTFGVASFVPLALRDELADVRDEVDFTLAWTKTFADRYQVSAGVTTVSCFEAGFHTQEVFTSLDVQLPAGFTVSGGVWGDVNLFRGVYYRAAVSWGDAWLDESLALTVEVNHGGARYDGDVYYPLEVGTAAELSYDLGAGATVAATGLYNYNPDERSHQWAAGIKTAYAF